MKVFIFMFEKLINIFCLLFCIMFEIFINDYNVKKKIIYDKNVLLYKIFIILNSEIIC